LKTKKAASVKLAGQSKKQVATEKNTAEDKSHISTRAAVFTKNDTHTMTANAGMDLVGFAVGADEEEY
jgi:hypothetical protein